MGPVARDAMPALAAALSDSDKEVRQAAAFALGRIGADALPTLMAALKDGKAHNPEAVMEAIGYLGTNAGDAVPVVLPLVGNQKLRLVAVQTLGNIGIVSDGSIEALAGATKDEDPAVRHAAIVSLGCLGEAAVPTLIGSLKNKGLRKDAVVALGKVGRSAAKAAPELCRLLKDDDGDVRRSAAASLGSIGSRSKEVVPALVEALGDKEAGDTAAHTLSGMRDAAIPALTKALQDKDRSERAASALAQMGKPAVPTMLELLRDDKLRPQAIAILGQMGPGAKAALPQLTSLAESEDEAVRLSASDAIKKINAKRGRGGA